MPNPIFTQQSEQEAIDSAEILNLGYANAGIDGTIEAVIVRINNWAAPTIPQPRVVEFGAANATKQNDFALFTALAQGPDYQGIDFVTAWETEYAKIY